MYGNKKNASNKKKIRKYFAAQAHHELIVFVKHKVGEAAVRRVSKYTISVSESFLDNYFIECSPDDKVILRIAEVLSSQESGYRKINMRDLLKIKKRGVPLQENESRRGGLE